MTSDPGSFARSTIVERKPKIIRQVKEDHTFPSEINLALDLFINEIAQGSIKPVQEEAPDAAFWNTELDSYVGRTWLEVPWYFAESFFYRRLLEATRYFQEGRYKNVDPFLKPKRRSMVTDEVWFAANWTQLQQIGSDRAFEALLHSCLWGNRADLSNYTVKEQVQGGLAAQSERHLVIIDHTAKVHGLLSGGVERVDFINDNVGKELLFDLALADFLLRQGWARHISFHLKDRAFFVSDATPVDVQATIDLLKRSAGETVGLGRRLDNFIQTGNLTLSTDPFWTSFLMFRQMPEALSLELNKANLVVIKGDVNYRRILDDRHWPFTTRMEEITVYFPAPFVSLRTLKGEIMVGLRPGQAEEMAASDPTWLINGKRGVIHFVDPGA
jgi:uncharacterized protein with ATP-grasp and redox domains